MIEKEKDNFRAGFVAILGRPNVGKSTLANALLGQKIAAVSPRPQTTRDRQMIILTDDEAQIILMDMPGMHNPLHKLGYAMNAIVEEGISEADIVLWLVDASQPPQAEDILIANYLHAVKDLTPLILCLNKVDLLLVKEKQTRADSFRNLYPEAADAIFISARELIGLDALLKKIKELLPISPPYYPEDQITDYQERQIAADLIREAALMVLQQEVPHAIAVRVDEFKERENGTAYIAATIFVEKDSQKGIVIGKGGEMLKKIGSMARKSIEEMSGRPVFLELRVKVSKNWRNNENFLQHIGYKIVRKKWPPTV